MKDIYPTCILLNTLTKRWHPIAFRPYPLPGPSGENHGRYKSIGEHREGFGTIEEALQHINGTEEFRLVGNIYGWDGKDVPAMVEIFGPALEGESVEELTDIIIKSAGELLAYLESHPEETVA